MGARSTKPVPDAAALYWRGRGALERGEWRHAAQSFRQAVRASPGDAELRRLLGLSLARLDRFDAAVAMFRSALAIAPDSARIQADLGVTLLKMGSDAEAARVLEQALTADPALQQARLCLGMALARTGEADRALAILEPAVRNSTDADLHSARAWAMLTQGRVAACVAALDLARRFNPNDAVAQTNRLFALQHLPGITAARLYAEHLAYAARLQDTPAPAARRLPEGSDALVIGILSGDLRRHAVGVLTLSAFEALAKRNCRIVCFANQQEHDDFSDRYRAASAAWHVVHALDDDALHALIARERVDILFDLSGITARNRFAVFARRAAPFQVSWAGYTGTTGLATVDALVADAREVPDGEDGFYTEQILRLPDCYVCFEPPSCAPDPAPRPDAAHIRFGCFQRAAKINASVLGLWARIAQAVPNACFVLRYGCYAEGQTRGVICEMAAQAGLETARIVFEPGGPQKHLLAGYTDIDVALDTFPYSGGVTTLEALWCGVPVVTLRGQTFAGRHSASHLHAVGLQELIAETAADYVRIAVLLAGDRVRLAALRAGLRARVAGSPLMDAERFADHLWAAVVSAYRSKQAVLF